MNFSKVIKAILFLLGFIAALQVILMNRIERLVQIADEPKLVFVEQVTEPVIEYEVPNIVSDLISRPIPEVEAVEPRIDCSLDDETQQMILEKSELFDVDFAFTMAVIFRESSFRPDVISANGADYGLMQINRINHKWLSEELGVRDFLDPEQNVTAGLFMLSDLFDKYGEPSLVLMAYNMGEPSAKKLWKQGIYTSDYAESIIQQAEIYQEEIQKRMGENDQM